VFLVGARRSGTNWLERILTAHPAIMALPSETYLFSHGIAPLAERFQHANPGSPMMGKAFIQRDGFLDGIRDLVDRALLDNLDARPASEVRYVVERTPWHAQHLPLIADVYPDARILHIIRDGRAVARSLLSVEWGPSTMTEAAAEWRDTVAGSRNGALLFGERYREMVYEQLLGDTAAEIEDLFAWLGLELPDAVRARIMFEARTEFNVDPSSPRVQADKWREELSPSDLVEFERIAGAELEAHGYERAARGATPAPPRRRTPRSLPDVGRRARDRALARWSRREIRRNHAAASRFDELLAVGDDDGAVELLSPKARVSLLDGDERRAGRGAVAAADLAAAVADHRRRGQRAVSGSIHLSPHAFTTVGTYELDDGSRWGRTLVLYVRHGRIIEVALYRFALRK
jgi:sulfotransferase family protein